MLEFSLKLRLYLSLLLVVGTALVKIENWISLFIYIIVSIFWIVLLRVKVEKLFKILSLQILFLGILVLPQGYERAGFLLLRSLVCLVFLTSFLLSIPAHTFGSIIRSLPLPAPLKLNLYFSVHFLEKLKIEIEKMNLSAQLRGLNGTTSWIRYTNASMIGSLFIRTLEKAERVNKAMYLRGFSGEFPPEKILQTKERIILNAILFLVSVITLGSYFFD